jgi:hypothetical protein
MGQYQSAAEKISKVASQSSSKKNRLLWALQETVVHYWAGDFASCLLAGERAELAIAEMEDAPSLSLSKMINRLGVFASNETQATYRGLASDKIMLHGFKALAYLMEGKPEASAVELRRAEQRRRMAFEQYRKAITASIGSAEGQTSRKLDRVLASDTFRQAVDRHYGVLDELPHYKDFSSPLTMFLDGALSAVRFGDRSSLEHAMSTLGTLKGMLVCDAFDLFLKECDSRRMGRHPRAWVHLIIERGFAPRKVSESIDIPLVIDGRVTGLHFAFPAMKPQPLSSEKSVAIIGEERFDSSLLCDVDAVQMRELKSQLPSLVWSQLASASSKALLESELSQVSPVLGLLAYGVNAGLNVADTRSWNLLPKQVELISVPLSTSQIKLKVGGQRLSIKGLAPDGDQLVHVKQVDGPLSYHTCPLWDPYGTSLPVDRNRLQSESVPSN